MKLVTQNPELITPNLELITQNSELKTPKVIVAIPCYNTEKHIANVIANVRKYVDEVVVIDDGSTDLTAVVALTAGARVISHSKNRGKGAAMKTAIENIETDILLFIDGDGQHDPADIPKLLEPILDGKADYVIGSRYLAKSKISSAPFIRRFTNSLASLVISVIISVFQRVARFISRQPARRNLKTSEISSSRNVDYRLLSGKFKWISDCTSGFTAIRKETCSELCLVSDRFEIETEMIFEQAKNGFIIAEVPISCSWEGSLSKLSVVKDGLTTLGLLVRKFVNYAGNTEKQKLNSEAPSVTEFSS